MKIMKPFDKKVGDMWSGIMKSAISGFQDRCKIFLILLITAAIFISAGCVGQYEASEDPTLDKRFEKTNHRLEEYITICFPVYRPKAQPQ